jgi:hypothetical protein
MRGYMKFLLLLFISASLSLVAKANDPIDDNILIAEPVLQGSVVDAATRKPVQGVIVSICTAKCQERKEVTTDASGSFKVPQMPTGEVTIVLEKKGYKTYRREGVMLKEGMSIKLNMDMRSEEEVEQDVFHPLMRMMDGMKK